MRALYVGLALVAGVLAGGRHAGAQEALYGAQPPKGSAYVRFVNATDSDIRLHPDFLPASQLGPHDTDRVGAYFVVENVAGRSLGFDVEAGARRGHASVSATPDGFLTIVVHQGADGGLAVTPIDDLAEFNQNRARLSFYNAAACDGGMLALEPGGQAVFRDVPPDSSKARAVNPANATLQASCGSAAAPPVDLSGVEAGSMFSVWLIDAGGRPNAFITRDIATPYKR